MGTLSNTFLLFLTSTQLAQFVHTFYSLEGCSYSLCAIPAFCALAGANKSPNTSVDIYLLSVRFEMKNEVILNQFIPLVFLLTAVSDISLKCLKTCRKLSPVCFKISHL